MADSEQLHTTEGLTTLKYSEAQMFPLIQRSGPADVTPCREDGSWRASRAASARDHWRLTGAALDTPVEVVVSKSEVWPRTRTVNPVPPAGTNDWVIWAAWADRITFEEIREVSGLDEAAVITLMRRSLKRSSFKRWRARATTKSIKHRRRFQAQREVLKSWTPHGAQAEDD